jgi:hypothetical protein
VSYLYDEIFCGGIAEGPYYILMNQTREKLLAVLQFIRAEDTYYEAPDSLIKPLILG